MRNIKLIILIAAFLLLIPNAHADGKYYVKVKNTKLRSAPQHFAPSLADLRLGDSVTGSDSSDEWVKVTTASKRSGYLHKATLSDVKIVTDMRNYNASADSSDVVLAGKGFNKEVEKSYAAKNPSMNFSEVNAMDQISISDSELISFVQSGGLKDNG